MPNKRTVVPTREPYTIQTTYFKPAVGMRERKEAQINLAKYPRSAVLRAVDHMQLDTYGADYCEVFDTNTNESHVRIWREGNKLEAQYGRDPRGYVLGGPSIRKKKEQV